MTMFVIAAIAVFALALGLFTVGFSIGWAAHAARLRHKESSRFFTDDARPKGVIEV